MIRTEAPLAPWTGYRTGGVARRLAVPRDETEFLDVLRARECERIPCFILGGGTNTLVADDSFDGLVIATVACAAVRQLGDGRIEAEAGATLRSLIGRAIRSGWRGLEGFVGIPGTIGGAVWGNAGGAAGGIAPLVEAVRLVDRDGVPEWVDGESLPWRYRHSGIGDRAILVVRLRLAPGASPSELRAAAGAVFSRKRSTQPLAARSAGCVFRNPPGESAGRLIEAAGLKGASLGDARVSTRHANFIVNEGNATSEQISGLIERIRARVAAEFGIWLEREIVAAPRAEGCRP
jgi:UDP-N-acetylmuramate dehydrogenase